MIVKLDKVRKRFEHEWIIKDLTHTFTSGKAYAILGPNGGNIGIGFAIPANMMKNLADQIIEHGEIRRGSLGIRGQDVTSDLTDAMNLNVSRGAFVNEVLADSAAEKAGLKSGDADVVLRAKRVQDGLLREGRNLFLDLA